ncbi:MAG: bifunctional oligoribonuclease/PAP phosphatase NrnA [Promethearchaeota archaeon]
MLKINYDNFLSFLKGKNILITTHDLVDIDGLASCFALKLFLIDYFNSANVSILFSEITKPTRKFMSKISTKFPDLIFLYNEEVSLSDYEICVIVDANEVSQIGLDLKNDTSELGVPYIFIDHHHFTKRTKTKENIDRLNIINDESSSTAELILNLFNQYSQKLPIPYRYLLVTAILTDSGFLKYGNNNTIQNLSILLDDDVNIQDIQMFLDRDIDISERIAQIKGLQRVELIREGNFLIGITNVSSFGAKVASTLIKIGFDIVLTHSIDKEKTLINGRAKKSICLKTGLHMGKIFEEISESYGGNGGGHDGAAALTFNKDFEFILKKIIKKIKNQLRTKL